EFGSSEYAKEILGELWGFPPALELEKEAALEKAIVELIGAGLIESAHDCSEGGLAVTSAEAAFGMNIGARLAIESRGLAPGFLLFGEDASRILVSLEPGKLAAVNELVTKHGISADVLGETSGERLEIQVDGRVVVSAAVSELKGCYEEALEGTLRGRGPAVTANRL
ncbi:MAG: phosphoribosylformylglycinamidine synthase II, partial [Acidobacteria bacterium]|nr:phosphoribosylformylglycinamidine synthase II [Acidobacteriota bacterium]